MSDYNTEFLEVQKESLYPYRTYIDTKYIKILSKYFKMPKLLEIINSTRIPQLEGQLTRTGLYNMLNNNYKKGDKKP